MAEKKKESLREMIDRLLEKSRDLRAEGVRLRRRSEKLEALVNHAQRTRSKKNPGWEEESEK